METNSKEYLPATPTVRKNTNGTVTVKNTPVDSTTTAWYLTAFYLEDDEWNVTGQIKKDTMIKSNLYQTSHSFNLEFSDNEKQSFIKVNCYNHGVYQGPYSATYLSFSDYALYFYPEYYLEADFTCNLKSYLECADNEIAVFADKPCLVQTFYCTNNLGDDKTQWISYAIEAKVQQKPESFTYTIPVREIPAGKYYVTVIHYADGTSKMTGVKQK